MADPLADLFDGQQTQSVDPLGDLFQGQQPASPGMAPGIARAVGQGLTFGFADEIEAKTRETFGGGSYDDIVKGIRESNAAFGKAHPIVSTVAEIGGALPTAMVPGMGGANLTRAVAQGGMREIARASASTGARTGATYGAGVGEGGVGDRASSAVKHAGIGGAGGFVAGPAIAGITRGIGNMARSAADAIYETGAPSHVNRALGRDGTGAAQIADDLINQARGQSPINPRTAESILVRYSEGRNVQGLSERDARRAAVGEYLQSLGIQNPTNQQRREAQRVVRETIGRYQSANEIPLQLHELPALRQASQGNQSNMAMRVAMNRTNDGADEFRDQLTTRQMGQGDRVDSLVSRALGGTNGDEALEAAREANKRTNRALYAQAEQADEAARIGAGTAPGVPAIPGQQLPVPVPGVSPINVDDIVNTMHVRWATREGRTAKGMREAVSLMADPDTGRGPTTLRQWLDMKEVLDGLIEDSMKPALVPGGNPQGTTLTRQLMQFKTELMDRIGQQNPLYRQANAEAARGFSNIRAAQTARNLTLTSSSKQRKALAAFERAPPEAQQLMRVMFAQNLSDKLLNAGMTHDMAKFFRTNSARQTMEAVLGRRAANEFIQHIERVGIGTRSFQHMGNSQTTPLAQAIKDADIGEGIKAILSHLNITKWPEKLGEYAARRANANRDAETLRMLGASTDRPDELFRVLRELQQSATTRQVQRAQPPLQNLSRAAAPFSATGINPIFGDNQ